MSDYNLVQFRKDLEQLPVILNQEQEEKFILYYELLVQWNEVMLSLIHILTLPTTSRV